MKTVKNLIIILSVMFLSANMCWGQDVQVDRTDSIWGVSAYPSENQEYVIVSFYTSADLELYNSVYMEVRGTKYHMFDYKELSKLQVTEQKLLYSSFVTFKFETSEEIPFESIYEIFFFLFHETPREAQSIETNKIVYNMEETSLNMIHSDEGHTDTIPADTIPQDTVPAVVPDTTLTLGVTDTFTYKLESGHILYCIAREDGNAKVYDIEGDGEVVIPENVFLEEKKFSVTEILVHGHDGLTQVTIPSSVLFHQDSLFVDCKRLKKVVVPNNCVRFPKDAFFGCDSLEVIAFGGTLKEWCEVSKSRWRVCLDSVKFVLKNHPIDVEVEGIVLRTVESIIIPEGVETIASCAFEDCDSLRSLILPKTLRKIEAWAFNSCSKLSLVEFPENLVEIEESAFMDCDNLSRIVCLANVPDIKDGERFQCTFTSYDADLFVPCEYLSSFKEHAVWGKFKNIYCAGADSVRIDEETDGFKATIDDMTATFTWEQVDSAVVYTLTVYKQDSVYCVVRFDENGTVMSLDLNELRSLKQGFAYKLTDLEGNMADYTYKFTAVGKDSNVLKEFKGEFALTNGVEDYLNGRNVALPFFVADDAIVVECASEMDVRIQNMLGQILYQGAGSVSFQTPAKGVYLVGCGAKTYKVIVR